MNRLAGLLFLFCLPLLLPGQHAWRAGEMEAKVFLPSAGSVALLKSLKLMDEPGLEEGRLMAWVYLTPEELPSLEASGLEYVITNPDLNGSSLHFWDREILDGYHTYNQLVELSDSLANHFPEICSKILLGTTPGGRQLAVLKISDNVEVDENEAEILFDGGIHGDEIMGPEVVIRYARDLCLAYGSDPAITDLVNTREIWLCYLLNPDGFASGSRYNSNGVDLNRDAGFMWGAEGYSPSPFSQPETKLLRSFWLAHNIAHNTSFHGGTEVIAYPWSYRTSLAPDWVHLNHLASLYSDSSGYPDLIYGQGCVIMYQIMGSTKDWIHGILGQVGWSMEISMLKQPPASQIGMYYSYNKPAMTEMIRRTGWGVEGTVTDSITGSPVRAALFIGSFYPVYTHPAVGDFHKYILPGTYSVTVKASGYQTKTITGVTVPAQGSAIVNVELTPDTAWYACKTLVTRIPYFPSSGYYLDESYVPGLIGPPDSVCYSIGSNGSIIIDMGDTIYDGTGDDLMVYEGDTSPEGYYCQVSETMDGPWTNLGLAMGTSSFDLVSGSVTKARYVKITDQGGGSGNAPDAGFDLDAVEILTPPLIPGFVAGTVTPCFGESVGFTDESSGNPSAWLWLFPGGEPSSSAEQNPSGILYSTPGQYDVTLTVTNSYAQVTLTRESYIQVGETPVVSLGPDTAVCAWESLILDAGNPGCTYEWSTGETTQTIVVDTSKFGLGLHQIWVKAVYGSACSDSDTIAVTIDACTGLPGWEKGPAVQIYPNPSDGTFTVRISRVGHGVITLVSAQGTVIGSTLLEYPVEELSLSFPHLPPGIYFMHIQTELWNIVKKVIIQ